jgi:hypothetical protein
MPTQKPPTEKTKSKSKMAKQAMPESTLSEGTVSEGIGPESVGAESAGAESAGVASESADAGSAAPDQNALRELCWQLGQRFPDQLRRQTIAFAPIHTRLGYLCWNVHDDAIQTLKAEKGGEFDGARFVIRVYDVTDVVFDGFNAHRFFDIDISDLRGRHYLSIDQLERNLMAEVGFVLRDGSFCPLVRSTTVFFDRERPSSRFHLRGLYVDRAFKRVVPVENVFDAPAFERLHAELPEGVAEDKPLHIAVFHMGGNDPLGRMLDEQLQRSEPFLVSHERFGSPIEASDTAALVSKVIENAPQLAVNVIEAHRKKPFDLLHAHDWMAVPAALEAKRQLGLPLVLSLHSTEEERAHGRELGGASLEIHRWEERGAAAAEVVVVPHSGTRQQLIHFAQADQERVLIIGDVFETEEPGLPDPAAEKRKLGFSDEHQIGFFAGEISHAAGADLLVDALINVCREFHRARFVFAGEGPLKGELEGRIHHAGLGHCARFLGDISWGHFESLLLACDYVVIPGRTWQDEGFAQQAINHGKAVLTTHQAHVGCVVHGENGLVTYDNPGSIIWGVKEMLANPLGGSMMRVVAKRQSGGLSSEGAAAEHVLAWRKALTVERRTDGPDLLPSEARKTIEARAVSRDERATKQSPAIMRKLAEKASDPELNVEITDRPTLETFVDDKESTSAAKGKRESDDG